MVDTVNVYYLFSKGEGAEEQGGMWLPAPVEMKADPTDTRSGACGRLEQLASSLFPGHAHTPDSL